MIAQGWGDQSDAARLHDDPELAIAANDRAGVARNRTPVHTVALNLERELVVQQVTPENLAA